MATLDREEDQLPVATVGRPGEAQWQQRGRAQGLDDTETGYTAPQQAAYRGRRRGGYVAQQSPRGSNSRALDLQEERIQGANTRSDNRDALREQELGLKQKEFEMQNMIHQHSIEDRKNVLDQTGGFLNSIDQISQQKDSPRGSKAFLAKVLSVAGQFPAAINSNPRLSAMVQTYNKDLKEQGGNDDMVFMLSELGQVDPHQPGAMEYLRTLPGKYVGAVGNKAVMDIYNQTLKSVNAAQPSLEAPEGTVMTKQTLTNPLGGSMTVEPADTQAAKAQAKAQDTQAKFLNTQLLNTQKSLDSAISRRAGIKPTADNKPVMDLLDAHINDKRGELDTLTKSIAAMGAKPSAGSADQVAPTGNGEDAVPDLSQAPVAGAPVGQQPKLNPLTDDITTSARAAIAAGKDPAAVRQRLQEKGFDPTGL